MIIRHTEKPPKHSNQDGPWDVLVNGQNRQRCVADRAWMAEGGSAEYLFAPYQSAPSNSEIATPDYIYAADPSGETHRPCETVTPLAAWLNYAQGSAQFNVSYSVGGGEPDLVKSVLARSGVVLICWEHDNIMPNIVGRINDSKYPIANYSAIPNAKAGRLLPRLAFRP